MRVCGWAGAAERVSYRELCLILLGERWLDKLDPDSEQGETQNTIPETGHRPGGTGRGVQEAKRRETQKKRESNETISN